VSTRIPVLSLSVVGSSTGSRLVNDFHRLINDSDRTVISIWIITVDRRYTEYRDVRHTTGTNVFGYTLCKNTCISTGRIRITDEQRWRANKTRTCLVITILFREGKTTRRTIPMSNVTCPPLSAAVQSAWKQCRSFRRHKNICLTSFFIDYFDNV